MKAKPKAQPQPTFFPSELTEIREKADAEESNDSVIWMLNSPSDLASAGEERKTPSITEIPI